MGRGVIPVCWRRLRVQRAILGLCGPAALITWRAVEILWVCRRLGALALHWPGDTSGRPYERRAESCTTALYAERKGFALHGMQEEAVMKIERTEGHEDPRRPSSKGLGQDV